MSLIKPRRSARDIIVAAQARVEHLRMPYSHVRYRHLVLIEAAKYQLDRREVKQLADHLGIDSSISPPLPVTETWIPSISEKFMSIKYEDPSNTNHYVIVVSNRSIFGVKGIIEHLPSGGYRDVKWFTDFVPMLKSVSDRYQKLLNNTSVWLKEKNQTEKNRVLIAQEINDPINANYSKGMCEEQIRAIHAFFKIYVPGVDGICKRCFQLNLPNSGFGERWFSEKTNRCEVRLSAAKPESKRESQRVLYVSHTFKKNEREVLVKFEGIATREPEVTWLKGPTLPILTTNRKDGDAHIPWEIYDYRSTSQSLELQLCQCQKNRI